ncbi:MAG: hypothetical protein EXR84_13890 [Gammaproteobacteria bacterium]|nr:hypothetical protein [Gammaproteobacteria bacterium]
MFSLLVVAILANGLYFWLQKSQVITSPALENYLYPVEIIPEDPVIDPPKFGLEGFYLVPQEWMITKLLKDIFVLAFIIVSVPYLRTSNLKPSKWLLVPASFGLSIAVAFFLSTWLYGVWVAIVGMRPITYLAAGMMGMWAADRRSMQLLCHYLVAVLILELLLALNEYQYGLPLFHTARLGNRVNGTFLFPSILGVFAVVVCTLAMCFSRISKILLLALTAALVYLTGSATALVLSVVMISIWAVLAVPHAWRMIVRMASLAILAVTVLTMPKLVERPDVFDALWGRIEPATDYWNHRPPVAQILFGKGLGLGSNVMNSALAQSTTIAKPTVDLFHARTDSTPLALVNQIGIVGCLLFYLMLGVAAWRDRRAAPVYVIIFLAGMTINLLELFPVNFLMGLLLCRSMLLPKDKSDSLESAQERPPNLR